jgi:hypothetical protein
MLLEIIQQLISQVCRNKLCTILMAIPANTVTCLVTQQQHSMHMACHQELRCMHMEGQLP